MPDQLQEHFEYSTAEHGFVVGSNGAGFAILTDGQAQVADQRPAALVGHCDQLCADSRTVIDDAQDGAWCAMVVPHKREINAPDAVDTDWRRRLIAQLA